MANPLGGLTNLVFRPNVEIEELQRLRSEQNAFTKRLKELVTAKAAN
jgi:hypothetical protein